MREKATLILLAGGESKRMGQPKHLLSTSRGTVIDHLHACLSPSFSETLLVGRGLSHELPELRMVEDLHPARSPLVGIYSGLVAAQTNLCFVLACDMPFVRPRLVEELLSRAFDADVVVPIVHGYYEPLCAVYRKSAIPVIATALERNDLKVTKIYEYLRLRTLPEEEVRTVDPDLSSFINLNTPHELPLLARL
jgi:molybdopterin-guanine dinucleotide biosynthesis protein A